tara:strand:+ start:507 stop:752 length:246 start_codon:yes stop_codon:yes gene_type:complete
MKLDIKSFLIGVLTTVNLFLLMGFDDHEEEKEIGRYQFEFSGEKSIVMDTTNGEFVKTKYWRAVDREVENNPNRLKQDYEN